MTVSTALVTVEQLQDVLPSNMKNNITQQMADNINKCSSDPLFREQYQENLLSFSHVMKDGKFKLESYIDAVKYVSYKLMGMTNNEAYSKTFPARYNKLLGDGKDQKTISSYVSAFNKNMLVQMVFEQSMTPVHILNHGAFQEAINTQVNLMRSAQSEKVRQDAANSIMTHLKPPEAKKVDLNIQTSEHNAVADLSATIRELSIQQQSMIKQGQVGVKEVAHSDIIGVEYSEKE